MRIQNFILAFVLLTFHPICTWSQDYQMKFFAYPEQSQIYRDRDGKWIFERTPHEHFYVHFEQRQQYEASYGYSPDTLISKYPFGFDYTKYGVFSGYPLYAHAFSMSEETYQKLKPDSSVYFFSSFHEGLRYANELIQALGKHTPALTDSNITPTTYVKEIIRLNSVNYDPFTDERDGQIYNTVKIGNHIWMAENLRFEPDSFRILSYKSETYGHHYDHKTALCACPSGWHLSTKEEWDALIADAGGTERASLNLRSTDFWMYPKTFTTSVPTDSLGFRVLPAGSPPHFVNGLARFWTASELYPGYVWVVTFTNYHKEVQLNTTINGEGLDRPQSVRCVKDH